MGRKKVEVDMKHATYEQVEILYKDCDVAKIKIRYLAILRFMDGYTSLDVAKIMYTSDSTVSDWLNRYNPRGT